MLIRLVARRTEAVGKLIFYPFIILFLLLISRLFYFDKWHTPLGLAIVISMSAFLAWICAVILRRSAETLRADVLSRLENRLTRVYAGESPDKTEVERIQYVLREVKEINRGAFAPYLQQPVLQSLLVPVGGLGGIKILEFLAKLG